MFMVPWESCDVENTNEMGATGIQNSSIKLFQRKPQESQQTGKQTS